MGIKPLAKIQRALTWLSVCSADESASLKEKRLYMVVTFFVMASIMSILVSSSVFFIKMLSIDLEQSLYALFQMTGLIAALNIIIATLIFRHEITNAFKNISNIFEICKYLVRENFFWCLKTDFS